jgi:uncharacterized membrane protein
MHFEAGIEIAASAQRVFDVYTDVERWPDWTSSVTRVERLDEGPLRLGSRARIRQPKLPVAVWEVTAIEPGRSFVWVARGPGLLTTGSHVVTSLAGNAVRVTASLDQDGIFGPLVGGLSRSLTQRYLELEVRGLKAHCES